MADEPQLSRTEDYSSSDDDTIRPDREEEHIAEIVEEELQALETPMGENSLAHRFREIVQEARADTVSENGSTDALPRRAGSPVDSLLSGPDDTPSVQGSLISFASPSSNVLPSLASRPGLSSPNPSFRPFDRRFQSRISSPYLSPRPSSPAFLAGHSRTASIMSQFMLDAGETDTPSPPWEVVRWTKLRKMNNQAFSEAGKRNFGSPTCLAVSASIVLGTSKGTILMFDYNQNLKMIIGPGTKAVESGPITSIAISADHSTVAGGHANGNIFTWDTSRPSRPFLSIPHLQEAQSRNLATDGHIPNVAVTHLCFLGTRHTALVSADDRGMAFSHLATRGTGAFGRTVKTTRILGRYPHAKPLVSVKKTKPSTVLAFAPLPLGNIERATDSFGMTAMLTPYLLVIVSTTPVALTQHKSNRPKEVAAHSAMTGCLAWFPAVKLKVPDPTTGSQISKVKLAYCWSNVLTVLDVDEIATEDRDKPPHLSFKARSRWTCEEAIVAVQWLSRSVLTVLTITQRLVVLEDRTMRMTEAFDLVDKYIFHSDLFSKQLHTLVEQHNEEDDSMHGVVADAFHMSFKTYKGRLFLLGFNDVSIGSLSNWADRLIALMENGDYIAAVQLATSYYTGDADKLTIGLPEDTDLRHSMVQDKLMEIMSASFKYAFGQRQKNRVNFDDNHLRELAEVCLFACHSVSDIDFVFDDMYEWYEDAEVEGIFVETLEPYILDETITAVPPGVVKAMITYFVSKGLESRLEEMIVHMNTATLDLDQITTLCKQYSLYDALIYVWNQALNDFITPLIDLLTLLVPLIQGAEYSGSGNIKDDEIFEVNATKMFPYLSFVLTGRIYPTGERIPDDISLKAKAEIYWFLFSGKSIAWPKGNSKKFLTKPQHSQEPSFPYLRMILKFDAPSFLSTLNEAFEDSFLNDSPDKQVTGDARRDLPEEQIFGLTVDRQYIVSILTEIMNPSDFAPADTIYLDMFIARNLPKYPQYLLFPGSTLTRVLTGLCNYPGEDIAEDAQLSAEYLLSVYQPPEMPDLTPLFKKAGFYRILKRIYRVDKQYGKLVQTYFEDPYDRDGVFDCVDECLRPQAKLNKRQVHEIHDVIKESARELIDLDPGRAAVTLATHAPGLHLHVLDAAADEPELQHSYLKTILEPEDGMLSKVKATPPERELIEQYVQLMCKFDPSHVADYVGLVQSSDLRLDKLLPTLEETGVVDAAVKLMAREGQVKEAMDRLTKHLHTLESALQGLLASAEQDKSFDLQFGAEGLILSLQKYMHVGIWLCQGQTRTMRGSAAVRRRQKPQSPTNESLAPDEALWLELVDTSVQITRQLSAALEAHSQEFGDFVAPSSEPNGHDHDDGNGFDTGKLLALLRSLVQHTFTALLSSTTAQATPRSSTANNINSNLSFLRILRAFLTRAATTSPNLSDLRAVLQSIFSAYAYEESILRLSNRLLERSLFVSVGLAAGLRQKGWRPRGSTCEACGGRVWGPGVSGNVFGAWEEKQAVEEKKRKEKLERLTHKGLDARDGGFGGVAGALDKGKGKGKGKGKENAGHGDHDLDQLMERRAAEDEGVDTELAGRGGKDQTLGPLVVFACRHIYHQTCLEDLQAREGWTGMNEHGRERQFKCPVDG